MPSVILWRVALEKVRAEGTLNIFLRWMEQYPDSYGTLFMFDKDIINITRYNEDLGRRYTNTLGITLNTFDKGLLECIREGRFRTYSCRIQNKTYNFETLAALLLTPNIIAIATYAR